MATVTAIDTIKKVVQFSAQIEVEITKEELINQFLDKVNMYKKYLVKLTGHIEELTDLLESLTRVGEYNDDDFVLIKFALDLCKDLSKRLAENYAEGNRECKKIGVAKNELVENKMAISDLKETISDIEMAFFILPNDDEFKKLNNELASLL